MLSTISEDYDFEKEKYIEPLTQILKNNCDITTIAHNKRHLAGKLSYYHSVMVQRYGRSEGKLSELTPWISLCKVHTKELSIGGA